MAKQKQQAAEFLKGVLGSGPLLSQDVWEQARQAGYSRRTYDRARKALRVQAQRQGWGAMGKWVLSLPQAKIRPIPLQVDLKHSAPITQLEHASKHAVQCYPPRKRA